MNGTWLLIDSHYLCHRAWHAGKHLEFKGRATGAVFGFLKTISDLKDRFSTENVAFCFEHPHLHRRDFFPAYKEKRHAKPLTHEEALERKKLYQQIAALRDDYLPRIGFRNVFCVEGFESDDLLAVLAGGLTGEEEGIIVTADADLLQCITERVSCYSPQSQKLTSLHSFKREHGFPPGDWALVKALAGCSGDGVPGLPGVGEITAAKYVRGELPATHKAMKVITSPKGQRVIARNRNLVELPYVGCPALEKREDRISRQGWLEVCDKLGLRSLAGRPPVSHRRSI